MNESSPLAPTTLKLVGVLLIVSSLVDYIVLAIPPQISEKEWLLGYVTQIVDRGVIPLVGLALLFAGFWIDGATGSLKPSRSPILDIRFWSLGLATVLGLVFLLALPLHLNNVRLLRSETLQRVRQEASVAETTLLAQLQSNEAKAAIEREQTQVKEQIQQLLADKERLDQFLGSDQVPPVLKEIVQESQKKPADVEKLVKDKLNLEALKDARLNEIRGRKDQAENQAKLRTAKAAAQTGISSLLLALGYSIIGWTGFKTLAIEGGGRRKGR
ncbi:HpsJ family protein [[Phormidium] sp. ETS-05]|uniref:hormogonium polysaccharide biosynthesis protein HpsJ n=1 Tax=[Phormidium] sp. ETS-05 TaxID=222819 RepID=UPI0018EF180C|nr:HpsJ family protein [[Phormidium] sp. ETS-05]